jgi:hypothetical protein
MIRRNWLLPGLVLAVLAAGCTQSHKRTVPPAPVYEKGQQVGVAVPSEGSAAGIETAGVSGPQVSLGGAVGTGQAVPKPEIAAPRPASEAASQVQPTASPAAAQLAYVPPPQPPATSVAPMSGAAKSLVSQADAKYLAGDLTGAASLLERAVRVEPRHPLPWNRLARVRLAQSSFGLAEELAKKSNALAGGDKALQRDNWQMISEARRAQGNPEGASAAMDTANNLR